VSVADGELVVERELRAVGEGMARARRTAQQMARLAAAWDLRGIRARLKDAEERLQEAANLLAALREALEEDGERSLAEAAEEYRARFVAEARALDLTLWGEFPEYEVFPVKVVFDLAGGQVHIGKGRVTTLEPRAVARAVRRAVDRLHRSSFNAERFMRALVTYHDLWRNARKIKGYQVRLLDIYRLMSAPMGSGAYTREDFAFAIYRLRRESDLVYDGRRLVFGHAKEASFAVPTGRGDVENLAWLEVLPVEGTE
jgi:hypothetical protein